MKFYGFYNKTEKYLPLPYKTVVENKILKRIRLVFLICDTSYECDDVN